VAVFDRCLHRHLGHLAQGSESAQMPSNRLIERFRMRLRAHLEIRVTMRVIKGGLKLQFQSDELTKDTPSGFELSVPRCWLHSAPILNPAQFRQTQTAFAVEIFLDHSEICWNELRNKS
jgi:hypothetical protein